jgi:hypothetical protein
VRFDNHHAHLSAKAKELLGCEPGTKLTFIPFE